MVKGFIKAASATAAIFGLVALVTDSLRTYYGLRAIDEESKAAYLQAARAPRSEQITHWGNYASYERRAALLGKITSINPVYNTFRYASRGAMGVYKKALKYTEFPALR